MDDNVVETCVVYNTEKRIEMFYRKYSECKACNKRSVLKRYYNKNDDILQQRRDKNSRFNDLDNRIKALDQKLSVLGLQLELLILGLGIKLKMCFKF